VSIAASFCRGCFAFFGFFLFFVCWLLLEFWTGFNEATTIRTKKKKQKMGFTGLASDVVHHLLSFLDPPTFVALTTVNRFLKTFQRSQNPIHFQSVLLDTCRVLSLVLDRRKNVLLHGPGGCGKTYCLSVLYEKATARGLQIVMTGTTGICASSLPMGVTIHSFLGLGKGTTPHQLLVDDLAKRPDYFKTKFRAWRQVDLLVIDEISMMGTRLWKLLDTVAKFARDDPRPFGGLQIVLSGDFLQLPPVGDQFLFTSPSWTSLDLQVVPFLVPFRHRTDSAFYKLLLRVRSGECTEGDLEKLKQRVLSKSDLPRLVIEGVGTRTFVPPFMFSNHRAVEALNTERLDSFEGWQQRSVARNTFFILRKDPTTGISTRIQVPPVPIPVHIESRIEHRQPSVLRLKEKGQYLITQNCSALGVVNGNMAILDFLDPKYQNFPYLYLKHRSATPIAAVELFQNLYYCVDPQRNLFVAREQYTLRPGYAITIHSAQGMTLDQAVVNAGSSIFAAAQTYVALSRVRHLQDLYLLDFVPKSLKVNPLAKRFVQQFERPETGRLKNSAEFSSTSSDPSSSSACTLASCSCLEGSRYSSEYTDDSPEFRSLKRKRNARGPV